MELWLGIEDYLQEQTQDRSRIIVFTGPIFSDVDPVYRGVDIPLRFFKVAAFIRQGFVPRPEAVEEVPPLGPLRTFQTPIRDVAELTGLDLDQLVAVDRMPIAAALGTARVGSIWRLLGDVEDLDLDFDLED
jgi:endonuclease G